MRNFCFGVFFSPLLCYVARQLCFFAMVVTVVGEAASVCTSGSADIGVVQSTTPRADVIQPASRQIPPHDRCSMTG